MNTAFPIRQVLTVLAAIPALYGVLPTVVSPGAIWAQVEHGRLAVDFVISAIVSTVFWGLALAVVLFNERRAIRLREPD
jgi:hypothetical protein